MYVMINDLKVGFKKIGTGSPILMVHGWGGSGESLLELGKMFKENSIYLIDLPGFGTSGDPPKGWGVEDYANLIRLFLEKLEIKAPIYIGHSFGGGLGIYLAAKYKGLISKLILLAPAYHREPVESEASKKVKRYIPNYSALKGLLRFPRKIYYKLFYPRSDAMKNPALAETYQKIICTDLREYVGMIEAPTLLLWGKKDKHTPETDSKFLVQKISNIEYHSFDNYTHGFPLKYPAKIYPLIYHFIEKWR